eukprot:scaffold11400_cov46-Phaeocystis_antarctica.AAC.2
MATRSTCTTMASHKKPLAQPPEPPPPPGPPPPPPPGLLPPRSAAPPASASATASAAASAASAAAVAVPASAVSDPTQGFSGSTSVLGIGAEGLGAGLPSRSGASVEEPVEESGASQAKAAAKAALDLRAAISPEVATSTREMATSISPESSTLEMATSPEPSTREMATSSASACTGGGGVEAGGASALCATGTGTSGSGTTSVGSVGSRHLVADAPRAAREGLHAADPRVVPAEWTPEARAWAGGWAEERCAVCSVRWAVRGGWAAGGGPRGVRDAWRVAWRVGGRVGPRGRRNEGRCERLGGGWTAGGGPCAVGGEWCGTWRVARGAGFQRRGHPWIPHTCSTSPLSYFTTGANLTRLVTAVRPSAARLALRLTDGLTNAICPLAAPLAALWPPIGRLPPSSGWLDIGGQSEANRSISSAGSDLMKTCLLAALPSAAGGVRISSILKERRCRPAVAYWRKVTRSLR